MIGNAMRARLVRSAGSGFASNSSGMALVEFALILPFLLLLFLAGTQLNLALTADRKVTILARTVSDLVGQSTILTAADVNNIFDAAASVIYPFPATGVHAVVSLVATDKDGNTTVKWSAARNATPLTAGDPVTIKNPQPNTAQILSTVQYDYTPPVPFAMIKAMTLSDTIQMRPRSTDSIIYKQQ